MDAGQVTSTEVPEAFDEVAERYDLMVGMSPGYHAQLRASADALLGALPGGALDPGADPDPDPSPSRRSRSRSRSRIREPEPRPELRPERGSGTHRCACSTSAAGPAHPPEPSSSRCAATRCRAASARQRARRRCWRWTARRACSTPRAPRPGRHGCRFAQGRAEALADQPELGEARAAGGLDGVLAAYLVRNVPDRDAVIAAIHDELRPGGVLAVHDYSVRGQPAATALWTAMCWAIVIPLGWLTSRNTSLYRYLWRSGLEMDSTAELEARLRRAGFVDVTTHHAAGWQRGIVHTVVGRRPAGA